MTKQKEAKFKAGALIENENDAQKPSKRAVIKATQNIDQLPTWEVARRMYVRHRLSVWKLLAFGTWAILIWQQF